MKLLEMRVMRDCFNSSMMRELVVDEPLEDDFIHYLGRFGKLCYYTHFERPFFQLRGEGFQIKGIKGNDTMTATLFESSDVVLRSIEDIIEQYRPL